MDVLHEAKNAALFGEELSAPLFPQIRFHVLLGSPTIVMVILKYAWRLFLRWQQQYIALYRYPKTLVPYCPFHIDAGASCAAEKNPHFTVKLNHQRWRHDPPVLLSCILNCGTPSPSPSVKTLRGMPFLWQLSLAFTPNFGFLPTFVLQSTVSSNDVLTRNQTPVASFHPMIHNIVQTQDLVTMQSGMWWDHAKQPVPALLIVANDYAKSEGATHSAAAANQWMRREIYWIQRIDAKFRKRRCHHSFPIAELLAFSDLRYTQLPSANKPLFPSLVLIQRRVSGPTFHEVIEMDRVHMSSSTAVVDKTVSDILRIRFKLACCHEALKQVLHYGFLSLRHNDLCPRNFWIDTCTEQRHGGTLYSCIDIKLGHVHTTTKLLDTTTLLFGTDPWFRSPEIARLVATQRSVEGSVEASALHTTNIGRTSDAWSAGLTLVCFLLAKDLARDCRDLGPLEFCPATGTWTVEPSDWIRELRKHLLFSQQSRYHPILVEAAISILTRLVVPERFDRDIPNTVKEIEQLLLAITK